MKEPRGTKPLCTKGAEGEKTPREGALVIWERGTGRGRAPPGAPVLRRPRAGGSLRGGDFVYVPEEIEA